jgi:hypothetical protein
MKDDVPEEMEVDGNIIVSPAIVPSVEDKGEDIPAIVPIVKPIEVQAEAMEVEMPTNVRRSSREKKYKPGLGDEIDMKFADPKTGKKYWYCGKVTKVDREDKDNIYCEFLDKFNPGWYDIKEEKSEVRKCIPSEKHKRTHKGQVHNIQDCMPVLSIQESAQNPKESEEKRKKRRIRQKEEGARAQRKKTKTNG